MNTTDRYETGPLRSRTVQSTIPVTATGMHLMVKHKMQGIRNTSNVARW
ncbi:hypothetical protein QTI51_31700 [Variovorax sp. J22G73]|nr:hypothetical protein [Variovorax sp. J22R203]MDM0101881.1 hypothetical protein [Variovorax sp. J22G73]